MDEAMVRWLRKITPIPEATKIFSLMLRREYDQRYAQLRKAQMKSQGVIAEIEEMQLKLAKGHAEGRYTDKVYDQLSKEYENRLIAIQIVNNEVKIEQYDIETICNFTNAFLGDLAKPYLIGDVGQKRLLLSLIFEKKLIWENGDFQTPKLAPDFALIDTLSDHDVNLGGVDGTRTRDLLRDRETL